MAVPLAIRCYLAIAIPSSETIYMPADWTGDLTVPCWAGTMRALCAVLHLTLAAAKPVQHRKVKSIHLCSAA
jgi:hypothetical protein